MWSHGTFYWNELMTRDVEKAKAFYGASIGWTYDSMPMPEGGTYCARVKQAIAAGATLMKPAFDVPGVGRIAIIKEPGGAGIGWMTPVNR